MAEPAPRFLIQTNERLGFSKGEQSFELGMTLDKFRAEFGRAEKSEKDDDDQGYLAHTITDYYTSDGLMVTARTDGTIIGFIFYMTPSPILKPSQAATDRGIAAGATENDVIRQYGDPYKKKQYKDDTSDDLQLYYKYGDSVLCFRFERQVLKAISLNADYLPYLNK